VQHDTEKIHLEVAFHRDRPCLSGMLSREYGGTVRQVADTAKRADSGLSLKADVDKLRIGEQYYLEWKWAELNQTQTIQ
jgi:hypothetical protein